MWFAIVQLNQVCIDCMLIQGMQRDKLTWTYRTKFRSTAEHTELGYQVFTWWLLGQGFANTEGNCM